MQNIDINNKLESLVGGRFTEEELNAKLSQLFGCAVEVQKYEREECTKKELPFLDDQFICSIKNKQVNLQIDVDLYYIIDNSKNYYITETNFEHF